MGEGGNLCTVSADDNSDDFGLDAGNMAWSWRVIPASGELCFLSSICLDGDKRIRCNGSGSIGVSSNQGGWEIWRLQHRPNGFVAISSWVHDGCFLVSNADGVVSSTRKLPDHGGGDEWKVCEFVGGRLNDSGRLIVSVKHKRYLACDGQRLYTAQAAAPVVDGSTVCSFEFPNGEWRLDCAHNNVYYVSSILRDQRIGCGPVSTTATSTLSRTTENLLAKPRAWIGRKPTTTPVMTHIPHATTNRSDWEQWRVDRYDEGMVTLYSVAHGVYLGVNSSKDIKATSKDVGPEELWVVQRYPVGGISFVPKIFKDDGLLLACNEDSMLCLADSWCEGGSCWKLEPLLPESSNRADVTRNLIGGASVALTLASGGVVLGLAYAGYYAAVNGISRHRRRSMLQLLDGASEATLRAIGVQDVTGLEEDLDPSLDKFLATWYLARGGVYVKRIIVEDTLVINQEPSSADPPRRAPVAADDNSRGDEMSSHHSLEHTVQAYHDIAHVRDQNDDTLVAAVVEADHSATPRITLPPFLASGTLPAGTVTARDRGEINCQQGTKSTKISSGRSRVNSNKG